MSPAKKALQGLETEIREFVKKRRKRKLIWSPYLREGSRWDHMMRMARPFKTSKFIVSRARSARRKRE